LIASGKVPLFEKGSNRSLEYRRGGGFGCEKKLGFGRVVGYDIQLKTVQHARINKFMTGERNDARFERWEGGIYAGLEESSKLA